MEDSAEPGYFLFFIIRKRCTSVTARFVLSDVTDSPSYRAKCIPRTTLHSHSVQIVLPSSHTRSNMAQSKINQWGVRSEPGNIWVTKASVWAVNNSRVFRLRRVNQRWRRRRRHGKTDSDWWLWVSRSTLATGRRWSFGEMRSRLLTRAFWMDTSVPAESRSDSFSKQVKAGERGLR